jgi:CRISPR-associated endonuclease Csn1
MGEKYFVGLDIGTDSVGWAVTDEHYKLMRMKGKTAWGSRIFSEASDAKSRRVFRTTGRRLARRKYRIQLLNQLFAPEIAKVDDSFFERLAQSAYQIDDKTGPVNAPYPLFKTRKEEVAFYRNWPTIWHLRADMLSGKPEAFADIRYVYLAIHHIIKYRGNFLIKGNVSTDKVDDAVFEAINSAIASLIAEETDSEIGDSDYMAIPSDKRESLFKILKDKETNKVQKRKALKQDVIQNYQGSEKVDAYLDMLRSLLVGGKYALKTIFDEPDPKDISFGADFDDLEEQYRSLFGDYYPIVEAAKRIHDTVFLSDLKGDSQWLSEAFVKVYKNHKKDLAELKRLAKLIDSAAGIKDVKKEKGVYFSLFIDPDCERNYPAFVHVRTNIGKRPSVQDFNKFVHSVLEPHEDIIGSEPSYGPLMKALENEDLLSIVANKSTSVIPHQLHEVELAKILDNAGKRYPFVNGIKDKVMALFRWRVPYYFGPLATSDKSEHAWLVRKSNEAITPWNVNEIVDVDATKEAFINRLTNNCQYLHGEKVLASDSIVYADYVNLNRLNGMRINDERIDEGTKKELFGFINSNRGQTLSVRGLKRFLLSKHKDIYGQDGVVISGLNETDKFSCKARFAFREAFDLEKDEAMVEEIINIQTIYKDDLDDGLAYLKKRYPSLTAKQQKAIKSFVPEGWGTLSWKLLKGLKWVDPVGVVHSIMDLLLETTDTFMEIYHNERYGFQKLVEEANGVAFGTESKQDRVNELIENASPMTRRSTIQALRIIAEIAKIKKCPPSEISIEVTREHDKKTNQALSRKKELSAFLKSLVKDKKETMLASQAKDVLSELEKQDLNALRGKHLYLYFKQAGLDLYTGKKIDINDINDATKYDTDHIIPQSKMKDDSMDNLALVNREANQRLKQDKYPLPETIRDNQTVRSLWRFLLDKKGINEKKYNNLIRDEPLNDQELQEFVARQINSLNITNILIRDCIVELYGIKPIFSKAQYPSYLRKSLSIPKIRDLNDCHHAVDAYLNIVAGVILQKHYGDPKLAYAQKKAGVKFTYNMENYLDKIMSEDSFKELVVDTCWRHDFLLTYRNTYQEDALYKQTIMRKSEGDLIPVHSSSDNPLHDTKKYGGYSQLSKTGFRIVDRKKGKKTLEPVSLMSLKRGEFKNESIVYPNQKVLLNGLEFLIMPKGEERISLKIVTPLFLSKDDSEYLALVIRFQKKFEECSDDSFTFSTDKDGLVKKTVSKELNKKVLMSFLSYAQCPKLSIVPYIGKFLKLFKEGTGMQDFENAKLFDQVTELVSVMKLFTRSSRDSKIDGIPTTVFLKSYSSLDDFDLSFVYESVTGLYRTVKKL